MALKPLDGSVRDVKSLREVLQEVEFHGVLVLDRGFASYDLAEIMDSGMDLASSFMYRDLGILCGFKKHDNYRIYM